MTDSPAKHEWNDLYDKLQKIFEGWAVESPYGYESKFGGGDYWIVNDYFEYRLKVYIWKWNIFSTSLLAKIRSLLIGRDPQWEIVIEFDTNEMTSDTPAMGIVVGVTDIKRSLNKQHLPDALNDVDFDRPD